MEKVKRTFENLLNDSNGRRGSPGGLPSHVLTKSAESFSELT
jgi:hypothetical protein